jgi:hypothetical protein
MRLQSILITSAIAIGLVAPVMAQQSTNMHRYALFFKYTNQAVKAMTENPQDRAAVAAKAVGIVGWKDGSHLFFSYER